MTASRPPVKPRKPSSEWKQSERLKVIKEMESDFIGKAELAKHLGCHINTLTGWMKDGTVPPPHSYPGEKHPIWLRKHYEHFRKTRRWPFEAYWNRQDPEV